jgi:hypothetical protein
MVWDQAEAILSMPTAAYPGVLDVEGRLLTISLPDPAMPSGEEGNQLGHRPGSLGRFLPGVTSSAALAACLEAHSLTLTDDGFLLPSASEKETAPDSKA